MAEAEWTDWNIAVRNGPKQSEVVKTAIKAAEKAGAACEDALDAKAKAEAPVAPAAPTVPGSAK